MEHDEKADELEREVEDMAEDSDKVKRSLDETEQDWEARQSDESMPGAVTEEAREVTDPEEDPPEAEGDEE